MVRGQPSARAPAGPKRESRHVAVHGLPAEIADERVSSFFCTFGRVQKVERQGEAAIVSFTDRLAAVKAHSSELRFEGTPLSLSFHEARSAHATSSPVGSTNSPAASQPPVPRPDSSQRAAASSATNSKRPSTSNGTAAVENAGRPTGGLQGVLVSGLPPGVPEPVLRAQLTSILAASRSRPKLIDISFERTGDVLKALLLLQNVADLNTLVADLNHATLASMPAGQRLRARPASHVAVVEAHNAYLSATAGVISASPNGPPFHSSRHDSPPDPCHKDANRTLYVGNLERRIKEDVLRARFSRFGVVLDVDIKNRDSHAPFAFLQFTDIESVANAIFAFQSNRTGMSGVKGEKLKCKVNWGKPQATSKLWIGALPRSCSHDFLFARLRNVAPDGVQEVIYDASNNEALILFRSVEQAAMVHAKIKGRLFVIPPEKPQKDSQSPAQQQVDFASDKLHDFFEDRKFGRIRVSDLINSSDSPPLTPSSQSAPPSRRSQQPPAVPLRRTSSRASLEKASRRTASASPGVSAVGDANAEAIAAQPTTSRSESADGAGSLLAPPPDPPTDLRPSSVEPPESADPAAMSSKHNRRSGSRRSSPDSLRRDHRRGRDHYDDRQRRKRSGSRSGYSSRYRDNKYQDRSSRRSSDARHRRRSPSSSGSSTSSIATSSSRTRSSSASSRGSVSSKRARSPPAVVGKTADESVGGHPSASREFPLPGSKPSSSHAPLVRADAVDCPLSSTSNGEQASPEVLSRLGRPSVSRPSKEAPVLPTAAQRPLNVFRDDHPVVLPRFREGGHRQPTSGGPSSAHESLLPQKDPRREDEHYVRAMQLDENPLICFPAFFLNDENGKAYCNRVFSMSPPTRRVSHPALPISRVKSDSTETSRPPHASVSRTTSSGSMDSRPPPLDLSGTEGGLQPLVPPFPPPPLGTPLRTPSECSAATPDFNGPSKSFNERLQTIHSKMDLLSRIPMAPVVPTPTGAEPAQSFEERLNRFKQKKKPPTSVGSPPAVAPSTSTAATAEGAKGARLTISIPPASSSTSSTPNIASPALVPFPPNLQQPPPPLPSPAAALPGIAGRSMSFTHPPAVSVDTSPVTLGLAPRSSSYAFQPSPAPLPLPPQPPQLQTVGLPPTSSLISPKTNIPPPNLSKPPPTLLVSPTVAPEHPPAAATSSLRPPHVQPSSGSLQPNPTTPSNLSAQFKPPGFQAGGSKSAVTSPLTATTPSTPKSASSTRDEPKGTPPADSAEEVRRKKEDQRKLFQSIRVPKKQPGTSTAEVFSFSSPLSRGQPAAPQPPTTAAVHTPNSAHPHPLRKVSEKPALKTTPSAGSIGKSPSIATPTTNGPPASTAEKIAKNREERERANEKAKQQAVKSGMLNQMKLDAAKLTAFMEKQRRQSNAEIEQTMEKVREKAARKFPADREQREKYVREKMDRFKQHQAQRLRLLEEEKRKKIEQKSAEARKKLSEAKSHPPKPAEKGEKLVKEKTEKEKHREKKDEREKERSREKEHAPEKEKNKTPKPSTASASAPPAANQKKKRQRTPSVSESSDESEDNSSEILAECGLRNIDLEMQRILFEEAKTGQLNLSMYERVKRKRANTVQSEEHKKQALDLLREKSDKKKKPKRVQMSSSEDSDGHSTTTKVKSSSGARSGSDGDSDVGETSDDGGGSTDAAKRKESSKKAAAKAELRRKAEKAVAKAKKAEKAAQKLSGKKSRKNTAGSTEDSETDRSKPSKSSKKPHHASSGEDSDDTTPSVVKKLHKNFAHFTQHETEDSEDDEAAKRRKKRKAKKMSALLGDDDFCANSDDDSSSLPAAPKRSTESGKSEVFKSQSTKAARPKEKKDRPTEPTASRKSESVEPKKPKKSKEHRESKQPLKEKAEPRKSAESNEAEPQKKKPKMSVKQEPLEPADPTAESKKRRRSTDEEGASIKRSKSMLGEENVKSERLSSPLHVNTAPATLEAPAKKSPVIEDFSFAPISPSPSTTSDSVRLENFVSQNCQSRDETPIISPLANRFGAVGQEKEVEEASTSLRTPADPPAPGEKFDRQRGSSFSSSSSSSSSSAASSSSSESSSANRAVEQSPSYAVEQLRNFHFVRALDEDAAKTSSVADVPPTPTAPAVAASSIKEPQLDEVPPPAAVEQKPAESGLEAKPPSAASSPLLPDDSARPNEDLPLDEDDDDEMDYESLLLSELNREDTPKLDETPPVVAEETFPPQCSQETEDAVESITALMADRNARSEDEEEDGFPMATITHPPISRSSSHGTNGTAELPAAAVASPPKSEQTAAAPPPITASPPAVSVPTSAASVELQLAPSAAELPPSSLPMEVPSASTASGRISPISSVVESIARGAPLPPEPLEEPAVARAQPPPVSIAAAPIVSAAASQLQNVASSIAHLPTPPPSRSSGGSPQYAAQLPCATGQQSPPAASLKPTTTTVQAPAPPPAVEKKAEIPAIVPPPVSHANPPTADPYAQMISPRPIGINSPDPAAAAFAQYQQQLLAQRGQMGGQRELMTAAEMFQRQAAIQQQQQQLPTTSADVSALLAMQQRSRAGSASGPPTSVQRKSGAPVAPPVTTSTPNVVQPPAPTIPAAVAQQPPQMLAGMPAVTPTSDRLANLLTSLSTNLGQPMNPALLQQIITNTDLAAQYPELAQIAAHPEAVEYLAHHFRTVQLQQEQQQMLQLQQREQQHMQAQQRLNEDAAALANLMNMAGPNASPELLRMLALQQHDLQRRQHEETQRQQQLLQQRQSAEQQRQLQQQEEMKRLVQLDAFRKSQFFPLMHPQQQAALPPNASIAAAMPSVLPTVPPVLPQTSTAASIPRFPPNANAHAEQSQYRLDEGRYPVCWQGNLALKSNGTRVQMHHVCGNQGLIETTANELAAPADDGLPTIRITQRMRLQNPHLVTVCNKMNNEDEFVALICFPCGEDAEQVSQQTTKMTSTFINYLTSKMAAGVVTRAPHAPHPSCVAHVFPPCEFAVQQLQRLAPEIFEEIDKSRSTYLFVVVTRSDGRPIGDDHVDEAKLSVVDTTDPSKFTS